MSSDNHINPTINGLEFKADDKCPIATTDVAVNLKNRQKAIDTAGYGPLNPTEPNNEFWRKKGERWDVSRSEARKQICGNCAAFIKTPKMLDCINSGLAAGDVSDAWATINAGDLGYCEAFDFKCASKRTCDAWIVGGPITDDTKIQEKSAEALSEQEKAVTEYLDSLSDADVEILFPSNTEMGEEETKWLFDVAGAFFRRALTGRKRRKRKDYEHESLEVKGDKPALRDPNGGLTAAGRKYFKEKEGANLRPGVKGAADTPMKMRRKGSFLVRFFTNPRGPLVDKNGNPTRLALSARAWGEPAPTTADAAKKLAAKGRSLLERYNRYQEAQKKGLTELSEIKALGPTVGQQRQNQTRPGSGGGGSSATRGNYDSNARDADGDGTVQEGTDYARPTKQNKPKPKPKSMRGTGGMPYTGKPGQRVQPRSNARPGRARIIPGGGRPVGPVTPTLRGDRDAFGRNVGYTKPKSTPQRNPRITREGDLRPNKNTDRATPQSGKTRPSSFGSADTTERGNIRRDLTNRGFDGEAFKKFTAAEAAKLKPGQKTNWNPGRLPNGGKIAADGTYIPPDVVRRDDKTQSDYYRNRRNNKPQPKMTREGDVVPNKNTNRSSGRPSNSTNPPRGTGSSNPYDGKPKMPWKPGPKKPGDLYKGPNMYDGKPKMPWKPGPKKPGDLYKGPNMYDGKPKMPWKSGPQKPGSNTKPGPYKSGPMKPWQR